MGWFKVDDQLPFHRKTIKAGNAAMGLWVRAGSWLRGQKGREEHPGVLTYAEARTMGTAGEIQRLIDAGYWHKCKLDGDRAVRFHDWHEFQPVSAELQEKRDEWATRKKRQRRHRQGDHSLCLPEYCEHAVPEDPPDSEWPNEA